jgi:hypothetical protein
VDFNKKTATVTMKSGKSLSKEACDKAFVGSNYKVASFQPRSTSK